MSEKNTRLNEFTDGDSDKPDRSQRLENKVDIIKGTKPDEVLDERSDGAEKYLVVDTLTGEDEKYAIDKSAPSAKPRDSIMIMDGSKSGRVYSGDSGILGSTMASLRPDGINPIFLYYFLESNFNRINSATKGSAVPHTDKDLVRSLEYGINSFSEQRKIATVLHTVDQAIEKTEEIIEKTEKMGRGLRQSLFTEGYYEHGTEQYGTLGEVPVSWQKTRLYKVADVARGKFTHRPRNDPEFYDGEYPFIQTGEVVEAVGELTDFSQTLNEKGRGVSREFAPGTIIITIAGNIGDTAVATFPVYFPDSLVGITPDEETDEQFLEQFLRYRQTFLNRLSTKTTQKNLNLTLMRPIEVVKPSLDEQKEIADTLSTVDNQIKKEKEYKNHLQRLKRGLMQYLLSGTVRTTETSISVPDEIEHYG